MSAAVYGARLRGEMRRQGWSTRRLMEETGLSESYVGSIRNGRAVPRLEVSERVAEALFAPALHEFVVEMRTRPCVVCSSPFLTNMKSITKRLYCNKACAQAAHRDSNLERYRSAREKHVKLATYRLVQYQSAVDAYCRACEPMGLCQTPECELRSVSPLPLSKDAA